MFKEWNEIVQVGKETFDPHCVVVVARIVAGLQDYLISIS